jgi:antitoxin (DNA-binding transcriptional repressor) of toxin-antitoxin stability system
MKTIDVRGATSLLRDYVGGLDGEPLIITDGESPVAALVPIDRTDLESLSLSSNPDFLNLIEKSRRRQRDEGGISSDEMRRRLGIQR